MNTTTENQICARCRHFQVKSETGEGTASSLRGRCLQLAARSRISIFAPLLPAEDRESLDIRLWGDFGCRFWEGKP